METNLPKHQEPSKNPETAALPPFSPLLFPRLPGDPRSDPRGPGPAAPPAAARRCPRRRAAAPRSAGPRRRTRRRRPPASDAGFCWFARGVACVFGKGVEHIVFLFDKKEKVSFAKQDPESATRQARGALLFFKSCTFFLLLMCSTLSNHIWMIAVSCSLSFRGGLTHSLTHSLKFARGLCGRS